MNPMASREFVIHVRRRWTLWILPTLAVLYFLGIIILAIMGELPTGRDEEILVLAGVALFALIFLVQIPFLLRRRARAREVPEEPLAPWSAEEQAAPAPAPIMAPVVRNDELVITDEMQKGFRVLEYSSPAKSENKGAVYAKTYVPVTKEYVLRVENVAADRAEI